MTVKQQIARKVHLIVMYEYDVYGSSAFSNMQRIKQLRIEIANLKKYGKANPSLFTKLFRKRKEYKV